LVLDFKKHVKDYRDPLYGFISVNEVEQKIIDSKYFQRLRHINQLGTTFLVYPSAMHTRFEHSLGVLFIVEKMLNHLFSNDYNIDALGWDKSDLGIAILSLRLAALLHDIGHPPFSHASENLFPTDKFQNQLDHEDYTYKLITETEIADIINNNIGTQEAVNVAEIAVGRAKDRDAAFLSDLLTGDFGADRIDYLMRDSYHLGVEYGKFDIHRLLNTLFIRYNEEKSGPELYIEDGGIHTIEAFILARYFMFTDVYFHKMRRILDNHLTEFICSCLENGRYPLDIFKYIYWNDHQIFYELNNRKQEELAKRLLNRKHYRLCFETTDHPELHELIKFNWMKYEVKNKFGEAVYLDEANKATYSFDQPEIFVLQNKHNEFRALSESSTVVRNLRRIEKCRVYGAPEICKDVMGFCNSFWKEKSC
jgi:HD superfamily phosphohydrolase